MRSGLLYLIGFLLIGNESLGQVSLLTTDFESGIPATFTIVDNDGNTPNTSVSEFNNAWISLSEPGNSSNTVAGSTSFFEPAGTADRWLITPALTMGSYGNFISWQARSHDESFPDDYLVLVSTTDDQLTSFTDTIGYVMEENGDWTFRTVDLSAEGYNDQTIRIAFINVTVDGFKLYLDDIEVWKEDPATVLESSVLHLTVFPNPFTELISVNSSSPLISVTIFDQSGKVVAYTDKVSIETSALRPGIYIMHVQTEAGYTVKKIIKH